MSIHKKMRRATLCVALGMCLASSAYAQSSAAGAIFGSAGEPGTTVVIQSLDTGLTREIKVGANGRYNATALPVGRYKVSLQRQGQVVATQDEVDVRLGAGSEVSFGAAGGADAIELGRIEVTAAGASPIDVSAVDTRSIFTAEQLTKIPVGRSIEAVALLAPGVVQADSRYPGAASFGGSAASENAFYINGYAVTNPLTNLGSTTLPFDGISQFQAITGGYGAEFGRATGGVVNIVTKRGTNDWKFGGLMTYSPKSLRAEQENIYYPANGTANDGLLYQNLKDRTVNTTTFGLYAGGPIIEDRLFVYATGEMTQQDVHTVAARPGSAVGALDYAYDMPRWMAKVDWNISDNHLVELTAVSDVTKTNLSQYNYRYTGATPLVAGTVKNGGYYYEDGGELYIGKYTGYLTDNLTLTALYGEQDQVHVAIPFMYDPSVVYVSDNRSIPNPVRAGSYAQLAFPDAYDSTSGGRLDLEWRVGDHSLRLGYDQQESESKAGQITSGPGGYRWQYDSVGVIGANSTIPGSGGARGPGGNGDYVMQYKFANGGTFSVEQEAFYVEDRWQLNDRWLLSLGLRNEAFTNFNADGLVYAEQKDQWAPRIGASWDVYGDSSMKLFANVGRYHLAMPNNVALRGAAGSLYTIEYFSFTGIDPVTGIPQGLTALGDGPNSNNNEYGQAPDPNSVTAKGLESHYQDEFVLGFEKQISSSFNVGARYVHRELKSAIDDMCDYRPARNWALANGYSAEVADNLGTELGSCRLFNPGVDNTFLLDDGTGNLVTVPLTAEELGFPKLKRMYQGIDMFVEHPFDGKWYAKLDYTLSRNYGNAEGQLKSDVGQGDVSQTMDWDHPELMEYSNGYLPNDRKHYVKAFGYYQFSPEWRVSSTLTWASGRPKNCLGIHVGGTDEFRDEVEYGGPYYHYCNGEPTPRGSAGRLPSTGRLDLGVTYAPNFADNKLQFSVDVFNVSDEQEVQNVMEYGEIGASGNPYHSTNRPISYSAPRSVRFAVKVDF